MSKDNSGITDEYVKSIQEKTNLKNSLYDEPWVPALLAPGTHALFSISPINLDEIIEIDDEISLQSFNHIQIPTNEKLISNQILHRGSAY